MQRPVAHTYRKPVVVGTRDEAIRLCGICLGEIKGGLPFAICDCGKLYHVTCGFRVGVCVSCGIQMDEGMRREPEGGAKPAAPREDVPTEVPSEVEPMRPARRLSVAQKLELLEERLLTGHISENLYKELKAKFEMERETADGDAAEVIAPALEPAFACPECGEALADGVASCPKCGLRLDESFACPECGASMERDQRRCSCGAEFTDVEVEYSCPMCGATQSGDTDECAACGAEFAGDALETGYECPECGRKVEESAAECQCGAVFDREEHQGTALQCPECGAEVSREDSFCPGCGARFADGAG
ncbi:MAG: zinc-ribbon domain-containing protein [Methanobacteriota archaeon]